MSMPFTGVLLVILVVALALATFIESSYGTDTAWAVIYGARWFDLIFILIAINLLGAIIREKLYRRKKMVVFIFHAAFLLIILGAGITRYFSTEGMMRIREGDTASTMVSDDTSIRLELTAGGETRHAEQEVRLSPLTPRKFRWSGRMDGKHVKVRSVDFVTNASRRYVATPGGIPYAQLILLSDHQYQVGIGSGQSVQYPGVTFSLDHPDPEATIELLSRDDVLVAVTRKPLIVSDMSGGVTQEVGAGDTLVLETKRLYRMGETRFALRRFLPEAEARYVERGGSGSDGGMNLVTLEVRYDGMVSELAVPGIATVPGDPVEQTMGDLHITASYGSREIELPFALHLNDFQIERYPGSNSPSSFASEVTLIDREQNIREDRRIYMNNVLKHRGYRFYQSSYDQDEKGTILSVNRDWLGTAVTYTGYFFLLAGMLAALLVPGTRFARMAKRTSRVSKVMLIGWMLIMGHSLAEARDMPAPGRDQAKEFGQLWVQGKEGRFKPVNTLANEVLRKITHDARYEGLTADQVLLGMVIYPEAWQEAPLFEVEHPRLHRMLDYRGSMVSFKDFVGRSGYLLRDLVNEAYSKKVQERSELDKEVIKLDERINVLYMVQSGDLLRIYPDPGSENRKWLSVAEVMQSEAAPRTDTLGKVFMLYIEALQNGNREITGDVVSFLDDYQQTDEDILPAEGRKKAEILYNRVKLFPRLIRFYGIFGVILVILQFLKLFRTRRWVKYMFNVGVIHLAVAFLLHTAALGLRWYISGHAPLSNGYESMIFVSWVSLLAGLIFVRRSGFAIGLTAILSTLSLLVAHMSWMNPEITNLVPVLKSPWLTIHVTVIMAGYGFLGLSALLGLVNIGFFASLRARNRKHIHAIISDVTRVNHLSMIAGLYFLTAGVFLGGVWANESWGRYWGWDPKETWALITTLVYAFIVHMHRFPGMRGSFAYNVAAFAGFSSVLMTYFGVNYFLGGIHSYAGGSPFTLPWYFYAIVLGLIVFCTIAYRRQLPYPPEPLKDLSTDHE